MAPARLKSLQAGSPQPLPVTAWLELRPHMALSAPAGATRHPAALPAAHNVPSSWLCPPRCPPRPGRARAASSRPTEEGPGIRH
ncbi:hypothetical protein NDU88_003762 [Pleurodeles waltl]|uniref:Uncharacterized protein n=1 Tax=Pleurodeles waltl TaxID=8319 RepID=A0AAV7LJT6_PLEWA|nr:hypothetical protein NDU88_003762 [Pleurodeles waltl]